VTTPVSLRFRQLKVPLKHTFRQASSTRTHGESIWVEAARNGVAGYGEGCPRSYVTRETLASCEAWLNERLEDIMASCRDLNALAAWSDEREAEIDASPSSWCAVEGALLDLFAREREISVEALLGQREVGGPYRYSAILGNDESWKTRLLIDQYLMMGMTDFKIKLSGNQADDRAKIDSIAELSQEYRATEVRVRADANNLWHKSPADALPYLRALDRKLFAIEEPVYPRDVETHAAISTGMNWPLILDESLCTVTDLELYDDAPGSYIANIKVSRVGGVRRALRLVDALKQRHWPIIIGAHVGETSVLTRAALTVANAAGDSLIAQEGAFGGRIVERETAVPSLRWSLRGELDLSRPYGEVTPEGLHITGPDAWRIGWGLACRFPADPAPQSETMERLIASDGYEIHARRWGPADGEHVIVILHGGMSHSAWQRPLAEALRDASGFSVVAPDRRGCGLNESRGDIGSADRSIDDVVEHLKHLAGRYEHVHLAGWCQGGQYAAIAAERLQGSSTVETLLLITPGFFWNARFRSVIDITERTVQSLLNHFDAAPDRLTAFVPVPLVATDFTLNDTWLDYIDGDALKTTELTLKSVLAMDEVQERSWNSILNVTLPTFVLFASEDRIVDNRKAQSFVGPMWRGNAKHEVVVVEGSHAVHFEHSAELAKRLVGFIHSRAQSA